jgi:hypothetical protein
MRGMGGRKDGRVCRLMERRCVCNSLSFLACFERNESGLEYYYSACALGAKQVYCVCVCALYFYFYFYFFVNLE